jgi:NAD(P)-dependent dehydrogenase (short-subunit alcohol dehydrogenase family)
MGLTMHKEVCLVTGVGPGTGTALVKCFAQRYRVAMIARDSDRLDALAEEVPGTRAYPCNVAKAETLLETLAAIQQDMGAPSVVVHNAVGGGMGDLLSIEPEVLERNFQINTMALLHLIQTFAPAMVDAGKGAILATGNTSAYRGKASFAPMAPTKAAQRILLESAARSLGPAGIHVSYVAIDAVIDVPWTREWYKDKPDDFFCQPGDIAAECFHLAHQPKSAWAFDSVIRPFGESW